ncbi:MAG: 2-oxoacid:acceptor oxidoreductase family protein [Clostridiales Family XIII bacterium]|jgi:pyruvate ferredoxin oxidoreductase gamma subunit|nr:2-oxoacid:acceptor oxidoreductase family protein [Clostridiales Family XIII bacterium]
MIEIRWHGRGGQGAKTAALMLADVAFSEGFYVQAFPEYGPERMGAPITAFTRINEKEIRVHTNIYAPDMVVIVDETLIGAVDMTKGLKEDGKIVVNTKRPPADVAEAFKDYKGEVYAVDAADISIRYLGKNLPNMPLLSVVTKLVGVITEDAFLNEMTENLKGKFSKKPEVIEGNLNAIKEAWNSAIRVNE